MSILSTTQPSLTPDPSASGAFGLLERFQAPPLSTKEVYAKIKPLICKVFGDASEGTGFFVGSSGLIVTAAHTKASSIEYLGRRYTVQSPALKDYNSKKASFFDFQLLEVISQEGESFYLEGMQFFELPEENLALEEGEEVYFGGFPLTQKSVTLHKGYISSVSSVDGFHSFTIDGNVVPGNSGGPVLMQQNGSLRLIGVIRSEISDLHPQFQKISDIFESVKTTESVHAFLDNVLNQAVPIGVATSLHMAFSSITANMSTGIGKAVNSRHLHDIFKGDESTADFTISLDEFLVTRKAKEEEKEIYKGRVIFSDTHGGKHLARADKYTSNGRRAWIEATKSCPASFYPEFKKHYDENLKAVVKIWIDRGGLQDDCVVEFPQPVGAASGQETFFVQIYSTGSGGYHLRPVLANEGKKETFEDVLNRDMQELKEMFKNLERMPQFEKEGRGNFTKEFKSAVKDFKERMLKVRGNYPAGHPDLELLKAQFGEMLAA